MPRARNPKVDKAENLYRKGLKLKDIAFELDLPEGTVRRWKSTYKWDSERSEKKANVRNKGGAPKGNKNAAGNGAPLRNNNAEKFGFFRKHLPEETVSIIEEMPKEPLDVLWDNIQIAYAAIIRAQSIMYVNSKEDKTKELIASGECSSAWDVQQAWDKQGNFLQAQARAQNTLQSMISKYEDLLHKNWEAATEEQKARIEKLKSETARIRGEDPDEEQQDDGFIDALKAEVKNIWEDE